MLYHKAFSLTNPSGTGGNWSRTDNVQKCMATLD